MSTGHVEFVVPVETSNYMGLEPKREVCARDRRQGVSCIQGVWN